LFHRTTETLVSVAHRLEISRTRPPKLKLPWPSGFQDHPSTSKDLTGKMSKKITTAGESNKVMADQAEEKFEKIRVGSEDRRSVKNRYRKSKIGDIAATAETDKMLVDRLAKAEDQSKEMSKEIAAAAETNKMMADRLAKVEDQLKEMNKKVNAAHATTLAATKTNKKMADSLAKAEEQSKELGRKLAAAERRLNEAEKKTKRLEEKQAKDNDKFQMEAMRRGLPAAGRRFDAHTISIAKFEAHNIRTDMMISNMPSPLCPICRLQIPRVNIETHVNSHFPPLC